MSIPGSRRLSISANDFRRGGQPLPPGNRHRCAGKVDDETVTRLGYEQWACVTCGPTLVFCRRCEKYSLSVASCEVYLKLSNSNMLSFAYNFFYAEVTLLLISASQFNISHICLSNPFWIVCGVMLMKSTFLFIKMPKYKLSGRQYKSESTHTALRIFSRDGKW